MSDELESRPTDTVLRDNTFGILDGEGSTDEKITRLLALLPMAFEVMDEARSTIARLRDENEALKRAQAAQQGWRQKARDAEDQRRLTQHS
ncbi:MAG TPA: hypothetical protein VIJ18_07230 [Microbacteriaceae bacterium]